MTTDESELREIAEGIKRDAEGSAFEEAAAAPREQLVSEVHSLLFLTSMYRPPSYAARVTDLSVDLFRDESHEMRDFWHRSSIEDLEDITAFNILLDEILWQPPSLTGSRRISITTLEGIVAGWAGIIGARAATDPDRTPLLAKIPTRLRGWRLIPPSLSESEASRRGGEIRSTLTALTLISTNLADRVTQCIVAHSTPPERDTLRQIYRELSKEHVSILTALQRASEHMIGKSVHPKGARRFISMFISHVAYRGLLIGYGATGPVGG